MTSKDLSIFNSLRPFSIGFDDMFDQFENMLGNGNLTMQSNYPPYNIRKTGKDNFCRLVTVSQTELLSNAFFVFLDPKEKLAFVHEKFFIIFFKTSSTAAITITTRSLAISISIFYAFPYSVRVRVAARVMHGIFERLRAQRALVKINLAFVHFNLSPGKKCFL